MCKTIEDSIFSGSLSYLTGGLLLATRKPKYIWAGVFILAVGSMQWIDAMIWYRKSQNLSSVAWSRFGVPTVLVLQLLTGYFGYVYYSGNRIFLYEPVLISIIVFIYAQYIIKCGESTTDANGYLIWCGKNNIDPEPFRLIGRTIIMLCLVFPFLFYPDDLIKYLIILASTGLWLYTVMSDSFGARWCQSFFVVDMMILGKLFLQGA